jgi:molybdenum cofactor biosynthesis enzyme MoaA
MQRNASQPWSVESDAVLKFNRMQGKLRVSVTHACQLHCRFCHQEGIGTHWRPVHMGLDYFRAVLDVYSAMGGWYVELTGGEPLIHPRISDFLKVAAEFKRHVTVHTNGLRLDRILPEVRVGCVQLIKMSLHAAANSSEARGLLGTAWDFDRVAANICRVIDTGIQVQLLYTLTKNNAAALPAVLDLALQWGVDLQLVDLIRSRNNDPLPALGYRAGNVLEDQVRQRAVYETTVSDRTGAKLKIFKTADGATWELKDTHYGLFHSAMCLNCPLKSICGEGIYALRVDAAGILKPCLLRQDLDATTKTHPVDERQLRSTMTRLIQEMMGANTETP